MEIRSRRFGMTLVMFIGLLFLILVGYSTKVVSHEYAHVQIFKYGGMNASIHLNLYGVAGGYTTVDSKPNLTEDEYRIVYVLNAMNESIGYSDLVSYFIQSTFLLLIFILLFIMILR